MLDFASEREGAYLGGYLHCRVDKKEKDISWLGISESVGMSVENKQNHKEGREQIANTEDEPLDVLRPSLHEVCRSGH